MHKTLTTAFNLFSGGALLCGTLFLGTKVADIAYTNKDDAKNNSFYQTQLEKISDIHQKSSHVTGPATAIFTSLSLVALGLKRKMKPD